MVFVDAAHEDAGTIQGLPHRERPPIPRSMIRGLSIVLGRLGMMRFRSRTIVMKVSIQFDQESLISVSHVRAEWRG